MELGQPFSFSKNGKLIIKDSVLENIDTLTEEELKEVLLRFQGQISNVMTSVYIPSASLMRIVKEYAPEMKVRFKTEKSGGNPIMPISSQEFFEGEAYFSTILSGINPTWTDLQKYKYLYNQLGMMLSYDLNLLPDASFSSLHDSIARNIFTSITKNWGVCASFAASYDYLCYRAGLESEIVSEEEHDYVVISISNMDLLSDVTFDSVALKFGMQTKNFGISKEQFKETGHHLEETEAADYEIDSLEDDRIEELDRTIGYLDLFGGTYTDASISSLSHDLEGTLTEKVESLSEKIKALKTVGRPSLHDYETIWNYVLNSSLDTNIKNGVRVTTNLNGKEPSKSNIVMTVTENGITQQLEFEIPNHQYQIGI